MLGKHTRLLSTALVIIILSVIVFALNSSAPAPIGRSTRVSHPDDPKAAAAELTSSEQSYIRRGRLSARLIRLLDVFGDRLERTGKERVTLSGVITRRGSSGAPVVIVLEFPLKLRLTVQSGLETEIILFDGHGAQKVGGVLGTADFNLIESLVYDSADYFFAQSGQTGATRFLGSHFRLDDGTDPNYSGPYYDIHQATARVSINSWIANRSKLYYFNSPTLLLERVRYKPEGSSEVETRMDDWRRIQGQHVPARIIRLENGLPVLSVDINSITIGPRVEDGIF